MSDEAGVKERFDDLAELRFYGILRVKAEVRRQGADPKYSDKIEVTSERGFAASSLEELGERAKQVLQDILKEQEDALGGKKIE
ncbi:hypothetical protein KKH23_06490 [Patescibacteria group bacterium]|uniref:Uncharacterized protein n=1 Tax=viral metagenome TaxID=1070528 RepID=A0A6M3LY75_9ZZZZ|nr:hypothetical protein [Patescibacteria group bacterium]